MRDGPTDGRHHRISAQADASEALREDNQSEAETARVDLRDWLGQEDWEQ